MVVTTTRGSLTAIEQTVPIQELLIPEHMTVQKKNPSTMNFRDIDHSDTVSKRPAEVLTSMELYRLYEVTLRGWQPPKKPHDLIHFAQP